MKPWLKACGRRAFERPLRRPSPPALARRLRVKASVDHLVDGRRVTVYVKTLAPNPQLEAMVRRASAARPYCG